VLLRAENLRQCGDGHAILCVNYSGTSPVETIQHAMLSLVSAVASSVGSAVGQ
jgi:hypothetical protein